MLRVSVLLLLFVPFSLWAEDTKAQFLTDYIVGSYRLIGKAPESNNTYYGTIEFRKISNKLHVIRTINNTMTHGNAEAEQVLHGETEILRIKFSEGGIDYEETCLIDSDLDNYARLTCYLYRRGEKTKEPGLEAYFITHG